MHKVYRILAREDKKTDCRSYKPPEEVFFWSKESINRWCKLVYLCYGEYVVRKSEYERCSECGKELRDSTDWALCRRQHLLDHYASTPEGRQTLDMLRGMGFKNEPDPHLRRKP